MLLGARNRKAGGEFRPLVSVLCFDLLSGVFWCGTLIRGQTTDRLSTLLLLALFLALKVPR
jgi:hypothetical protein